MSFQFPAFRLKNPTALHLGLSRFQHLADFCGQWGDAHLVVLRHEVHIVLALDLVRLVHEVDVVPRRVHDFLLPASGREEERIPLPFLLSHFLEQLFDVGIGICARLLLHRLRHAHQLRCVFDPGLFEVVLQHGEHDAHFCVDGFLRELFRLQGFHVGVERIGCSKVTDEAHALRQVGKQVVQGGGVERECLGPLPLFQL